MKKKSDLSRAFSEDGAHKTHVGGQALLEGIMMRGRYNWAVAVREPKGSIYLEEHTLASGQKKNSWMYWPLMRGCRAMMESLILGYKALSIAAEHAFPEEEEENQASVKGVQTAVECDKQAGLSDGSACVSEAEPRNDSPTELTSISSDVLPYDLQNKETLSKAENGGQSAGLGGASMVISMVLGLVIGIALFIVAPAALTNLIVGEYDSHTLAWNIVDGILRVVVFVAYLWLIGLMPDIKRMFGYHGAEHKTIHCYEHGLELTPENARKFPCLHVRCGTAFLIMVMIIAILVYTILPVNALIAAWGVPDGLPKLLLVIAIRILFMPLIAGISYEITVKWAGSRPDNPIVKAVLWPGMQMQYLTTREPDDNQIECAIAAMQRVLEYERKKEQEDSNGVETVGSKSPSAA